MIEPSMGVSVFWGIPKTIGFSTKMVWLGWFGRTPIFRKACVVEQFNQFLVFIYSLSHRIQLYMVTWVPSIYPSHVSIYTIHGSYGYRKHIVVESPGWTISSGAMRWWPPTSGSPMLFSPAAVPKKAHETADGWGFLKSLPENTVSEVSGSLKSEFGLKPIDIQSSFILFMSSKPVLVGWSWDFSMGKPGCNLPWLGDGFNLIRILMTWGNGVWQPGCTTKKVVVSVKMLRLYPNLGR